MRGQFLVLACATAALGCGGGPRPGAAAGTELASGYVLVPPSAWLRSAPVDAAPGAHGTSGGACSSPSTSPTSVQSPWVMRLVGASGDWLLVENLQPQEAEPHCYRHVAALVGWRLRLAVRREDVVIVTTREVHADFEDGTGYTLAAGVALTPDGDEYVVRVDDHELRVPVDHGAAGWSYAAPSSRFLEEDYEYDDDDGALPGGVPLLDGDAARVYARSVERDGDFVTVDAACSSLRLKLPEGEGGTGFGTNGCGSPGAAVDATSPRLAAGASLTWPDGSPAGEALQDQVLTWPAQVIGDRRCFRLPLVRAADWPDPGAPRDEWFLTLCADEREWQAP